jgi:hypothetical protein
MLVDPNNVPALKKIVNRDYSARRSSIAAGMANHSTATVTSKTDSRYHRNNSTFKFEEHFAKRSSLQFDMMGGNPSVSIIHGNNS